MTEWTKAYQTDNLMQAHCVKGLLEQSGLKTQITGEALQGAIGELPATGLNIELYVFYTQLNQARQIIKTYESAAGEQWQCNKCHEINESTFEICWHCSHDPLS
ncbi:DUF2007 domain-containing protein [Catenovulum sp. 2E275]|uniref:putative signal transducing protein n=1 Tax=Catenovulum sp. 2E275 TaxID=2980497 RepID=UPI0021CE91E8|nr:DUF2007 domain-containing protein [Catenovulum sp. 2E275]MCU4675863.1 DUF2007 domain-containing protein [Catenovulum sp. 2E275]